MADAYTNILNTAVQPVDVRKFSQVFGAAEYIAVEVLVSPLGEYLINGEKLTDNSEAGLRSALLRLGQDKAALPMIITADANASYQAVVRVMDVAGQLGFDKLSLTTREADEEGQ